MATFKTLADLGHLATRVALQLHADGPVSAPPRDRVHDPLGSATVIGPHLAITCAHVLDDYFKTYDLGSGATETNFYLSAIMILEDGRSGIEFRVEKVTMVANTDLALLMLSPNGSAPHNYEWVLPVIDLLPPPIGSAITALGYNNASCLLDHDNRRAIIKRDMSVTTGTVFDVYEERRDSVRMPFPCFHTDARFDNGMSGLSIGSISGPTARATPVR